MTTTTTTRIFRAPNNDGSGREDYHVEINGAAHSAQYGPFRKLNAARQFAKEKAGLIYWQTGEGSY